MGAGDLELLDLIYDDDGSSDLPRLKVGDQASNAGVGQDCVYLATDGFISQPIGPDGNGACASAIVWTPGNDRLVISAADARYNSKAGSLAAGDRAVVSNCDAFLKLTQAANKIQLAATPESMEITLDAANNKVVLSTEHMSVTLDATANRMTLLWTDGAVTFGSVTLGISQTIPVQLEVASPGGAADIKLTPTGLGQVLIDAPGGLFVNGVQVT